VSAALAQVGEFSFILAGLGLSYGLLPSTGFSLVLAGALLSIALNAFAFNAADWLTGIVRRSPALDGRFETARSGALVRLADDLEVARIKAAEKAAAHKTLSPQELVERFPMFAHLTLEQREVVILHFQPATAQPGERVIRKGDEADAAYFISSGAVEVRVANRRIRLGPGEFFGEMALISGQPRSANVTALDYCTFLKLTTSDFNEILRRYPDIRGHILELAKERDEMNRVPDTPGAGAGAIAVPGVRENARPEGKPRTGTRT
jgi:CPA2 family monovalent cation:H+ antiporter-2